MSHSADWVPAMIRRDGTELLLEWCHLGDIRFTDPFFEQSIDRAMRAPFNLLFSHRTPLREVAGQSPELNLAGLIFHMSRCGSTVVSNMLAALPENVVLSEPAPLDQLLRLVMPNMPQDRLVDLMRGFVAALARKRREQERDLFIKLDAWHVLLLPLFRRAFPDVPWLFVYRDPLEVLASIVKDRPRQLFPHWIPPALLSLASAPVDLDDYGAQVIANFLQAAIAHHDDGGLLVEYGELPEAACTRIRDHFGLRYREADLAMMRAAALSHAKRPSERFRPDGAAKRQEASEEIRRLAQTHLRPLYDKLDVTRAGAR